jgi:CBS domain-containing protein
MSGELPQQQEKRHEEDDAIDAVITKMTTHNVIRVPVVRGGKLVGVIARAAILSRTIEPEFVTVVAGTEGNNG